MPTPDAPSTKTPAPPPRNFGPSQRALGQRRLLLALLRGAGVGLLLVLGLACQGDEPGPNLALWAGLAVAGVALWLWQGRRLLAPLAERRLLLHDQALELQRGAFKRFVVYEGLRHVKLVQGPEERLLSLRLDLDDDSVLLRDLEGLPEAFAAVAGSKPDSAIIEIEQRRFDWGEPAPWIVLTFGLVLLLGLLLAL
ncbi:MAG TPA: hypothetical protein VK842_04200 [bacterium]|nr:hypothetical protein [bacterium]